MIIPKAERLNTVKAYYFVKKLEEIARLNKEGKNVISFGIGSPDLEPSPETIEALTKTASASTTHGYQPYRGIPELREKIGQWYAKTYGVQLNPDKEILPLMGSKEGILHLSLAFLNPGDKVLVPDPGYPTYTSLTKLTGGEVIKYDLKEEHGWLPDIDQLRQQNLTGVKMMWLNYPHMPTGTEANVAVLEKLVKFAAEQHILLCYDNPYSLVLNKKAPLSLLAIDRAKEVSIELNSLSKSHNMAGWRIGMMLGSEDYLSTALSIKSNIDSGMFLGLQKAAIKALDNSDEWHAQRNRIYGERRELIYKILDLMNFSYSKDQVGMFVWAKPNNPEVAEDVAGFVDKILHTAYVFFTPGEIFGNNGKKFLRLSLCVPKEKMQQAYERLVTLKEKGAI